MAKVVPFPSASTPRARQEAEALAASLNSLTDELHSLTKAFVEVQGKRRGLSGPELEAFAAGLGAMVAPQVAQRFTAAAAAIDNGA